MYLKKKINNKNLDKHSTIKSYRKIFNLPIWSNASTMYAVNNICNFEAMLRKNIYRFIQRLQDNDNLLIQCICKSWVMKFSIIMEPLD